jgi:hypothetical protein
MVGLPNLAALVWPGTGLVWLAVSVLIYVGVMLATRLQPGTADGRPAE